MRFITRRVDYSMMDYLERERERERENCEKADVEPLNVTNFNKN